MGYQNHAENQAEGPNCMILHIPSAAAMGPDNMIDGSKCPSVLKDLERMTRPRTRSRDEPRSLRSKPQAAAQVFDKGMYTVVLSTSGAAAAAALEQVPTNRRPEVPPYFLGYYERLFPGWALALCCYEQASFVADPLLWWYEPMFPDKLFAPGLDAHDGRLPRLESKVHRDHRVIFGLEDEARGLVPLPGLDNNYPQLRELLPRSAHQFHREGKERNGDFVADVATLRRGRPKLLRFAPEEPVLRGGEET